MQEPTQVGTGRIGAQHSVTSPGAFVGVDPNLPDVWREPPEELGGQDLLKERLINPDDEDENDGRDEWNTTTYTNDWTMKPAPALGGFEDGVFLNEFVNSPFQSIPSSPYFQQLQQAFTVPLSPMFVHSDASANQHAHSSASSAASTAHSPAAISHVGTPNPSTPPITIGHLTPTTPIPQYHVALPAIVPGNPVQARTRVSPPTTQVQTHFPPPHTQSPEQQHVHKAVKRACIACRKLKTSCDEGRPCGRCVRFGRECVDRSEEEIAAAKSRRAKKPAAAALRKDVTMTTNEEVKSHKRPNSETVSHMHNPINTAMLDPSDPATYAGSNEATEAMSAHLYSQCYLAHMIKGGLRDSILNNHAMLEARNPPLEAEAMLEWHSQVCLSFLLFADSMAADDFRIFITDGLSDEQLNSSTFLTSPLACWARLSTRPFHYAVQPNTIVLENHLRPSQDPMLNDIASARLKLEWLPSAHDNFQRWQQMLLNRLRFEVQLRKDRYSLRFGSGVPQPLQQQEVVLTPAIQGTCIDVPAMAISDEDDLSSKFSVLGIARALEAPPAKPTEHDRVTNIHACWCPQNVGALPDPISDGGQEGSKVKRTDGRPCIHTDGASGGSLGGSSSSSTASCSSASLPECVCALSTPLPLRVYVSHAFEVFFGWRRIEVERGMMQEGFKWTRRHYPPRTWPAAHQAAVAHTKLTLDMVANRLFKNSSFAPRTRSRLPQLPTVARPHVVESQVASPSFITRIGTVIAASSKALTVQSSDGDSTSAAVFISWQIPHGTAPIQTTPDDCHQHSH